MALKVNKNQRQYSFSKQPTLHIKTSHLRLREALLKHWNIIAADQQLSRLFPHRPIIAYKRAPNLKDSLVKSRFSPDQESNETEESYDGVLLDGLIAAL